MVIIMFYEFNHLGSPDYLKIEKGFNLSFPAHLHQCFEIIMILSGEMIITVDGKLFSLEKNEAILIFPNQIHELKSTTSEHALCIFSPKLVQAYANKLINKIPLNNKFRPDVYLIEMLKSFNLNASTLAEKKGLLYSLCGQFDKTAQYTEKKTDHEKLLYKIFAFVEENFCNDCSLSNLSKKIGYDYSYLSRHFKKTVGISYNSYVTHYRLSYACYLMENTEQTILQCAYNSGFSSLRNFNRCFKEYFKITPTQYLFIYTNKNTVS